MFLKNSLDNGNKDLNRPSIKSHASQKKFCRFKYFESLPKYSLEQPTIGAGPYKGTEKDQLKAEEKISKKKWLTKDGF